MFKGEVGTRSNSISWLGQSEGALGGEFYRAVPWFEQGFRKDEGAYPVGE